MKTGKRPRRRKEPNRMRLVTICPECGCRIKLSNRPRIGQRRVCNECSANLEIVSLTPLELDIYEPIVRRPTRNERTKPAAETFCPGCGYPLNCGTRSRRSQQVTCPQCQTRLKVVSSEPLELDVPTV